MKKITLAILTFALFSTTHAASDFDLKKACINNGGPSQSFCSCFSNRLADLNADEKIAALAMLFRNENIAKQNNVKLPGPKMHQIQRMMQGAAAQCK